MADFVGDCSRKKRARKTYDRERNTKTGAQAFFFGYFWLYRGGRAIFLYCLPGMILVGGGDVIAFYLFPLAPSFFFFYLRFALDFFWGPKRFG